VLNQIFAVCGLVASAGLSLVFTIRFSVLTIIRDIHTTNDVFLTSSGAEVDPQRRLMAEKFEMKYQSLPLLKFIKDHQKYVRKDFATPLH